MLVAKNSENKAIFYDIVNIKEKRASSLIQRTENGLAGGKKSLSTNSISENSENVNSFSEKSAETNSQSIANLEG